MEDAGLLLGAEPDNFGTQARYDRLDPVTGHLATRAVAATVADANRAVEAADHALAAWSALGPNARRSFLLRGRRDLGRAQGTPSSRPCRRRSARTVAWAGFNVMLASNMLREAAALTTLVCGETMPSDKPGCLAISLREPAGVCVGIAPWNAPIILGVRAVATALACGNTVVLKASELCPAYPCADRRGVSRREPADWRRQRHHQRAGGCRRHRQRPHRSSLCSANQFHRVGRGLVGSSPNVPPVISSPVLLELGGKAPLLVLESADLDEAVKAAAFGAFFNQGPDLHVDGADHRRRRGRGRIRRQIRGEGAFADGRRSPQRQGAARRGGRLTNRDVPSRA